MGIEVNGVAAASSYQTQTSQAVKQVSQVANTTTTTDKGNQVITDTSKSSASNVAVSVGQAAESEKNGNSAYDNDKAQEKKAESMADVKDIRKILNDNTVAEFSYNEPTKRIAIKIKDKDTDEVIKEIPSEKALEMLAKAWELAGILVDERR